ncbi:MAG: hypothetical protein IJZ53_07615 [Tyzzerella sp.]|nr:hypothetical protein [Tyzzerella sp.]
MVKKTSRESSDPYYDLIEDFDLIVSSFQTQYGIRLSRDLKGMKWDEFKDLLSGLGPETPLGRIVSIRAEEDKDILKHFTKDQHKIRNAWRSKKAKQMSQNEIDNVLEMFKNAFISMAGGKSNR